MGTWNGLNRFDGYQFRCFKTNAGDGCDMPSDRFRNIMAKGDDIYCKVDDSYYAFNTKSYTFKALHNIDNSPFRPFPHHQPTCATHRCLWHIVENT